jgi:hypothetical protein
VPEIALPVLRNGLLIDVRVGISAPRQAWLWKKGLQHPPPVRAEFVIDTGADRTMVNDRILLNLGLQPTESTRVLTSSSAGKPETCDVYDISLEMRGKGNAAWRSSSLAVLGRHLPNDSIEGMIGRDILDRMVLVYDGPQRMFRLHFASGAEPS